jgi:hypothetical protein
VIGVIVARTIAVFAPRRARISGGEALPDPSDNGLAGFDEQLAMVAADGEPEKVESVVEVDNTRLVLVEGKTPGRQPHGQPCLDLFSFLPGVAEGDHVVGVPYQRGRVSFSPPCVTAFLPDSGRFLQPMQRDVH